MDITPFISNRISNLIVCVTIVVIISILMLRHKRNAAYLFPPLFWVMHGTLFYTYWLMSYFGYFGLTFHLQAMNDWGSVFVAHGLWSLFLIVAGLLFRFTHVVFYPVIILLFNGGRGG